MSMLHIDRLRQGVGTEGEYEAVESSPLPNWEADVALDTVGHPRPRLDAVAKVTGKARYSFDVRLPGQLHARILRSPHPHARVIRVHTSRALAVPGVRAVISSADAPEIGWFTDSLLFEHTVRYIGDEVAAVAADSEEIAQDALRLIEVEYETLPFVTDFEAALKPEAPKLRPNGNLDSEPKVYERGSVDDGIAEATAVIDETYVTATALHNCLEPHGCVASWEDDSLTLWDSTQSIFQVRDAVAEKLGLPSNRVRVIKQFMGDGFGSKQIAWKHTVVAALLSKRAGRPVQLMLDRESENLASGNRNPTRQRVRLGARRDGTLTAIRTEIVRGNGAYQVGGEGSEVAGPYQRLYHCPNVRTEMVGVYMNTRPSVAFRASPGWVEGAFALESAMDELARKLEMDPLELRLRNYADTDQQRDVSYSSPNALRKCYESAAEAFGWRTRQRPSSNGPKRRGIGIAAHDWGGSGYPPGYAWVKVLGDGTVEVVTGTQDIGTGTRTGLAQVAAEEMTLPLEKVALQLGDTAYGPYAPVSSGSATQATIGPAVRSAAADARAQLIEAAATMLEVHPDDLQLQDGRIGLKDGGGRSMTVAEVMSEITPHMVIGRGARGPNPKDLSIRTFGAQCVEVEVDIETGEITVLRVVAAHDCGRVVNPTMVKSQVIGAVTQGTGFALTEERIVDHRDGVVLNPNLEHYLVPTVADIPEITYAGIDLPDTRANPTGSKGIGEPPLVPTAPAIANAVFDACGVRLHTGPLTRQRLLDALAASPNGHVGGVQ